MRTVCLKVYNGRNGEHVRAVVKYSCHVNVSSHVLMKHVVVVIPREHSCPIVCAPGWLKCAVNETRFSQHEILSQVKNSQSSYQTLSQNYLNKTE